MHEIHFLTVKDHLEQVAQVSLFLTLNSKFKIKKDYRENSRWFRVPAFENNTYIIINNN